MKSYAVVALAAVQGSVALPTDTLVPESVGRLDDNHVIHSTLPPDLIFSACYQDSKGQRLDGKVVKIPCISEQEIVSYCADNYRTDLEAWARCLFGKDSSYKSDHRCCIKCRVMNGDGMEGSWEQAVDFINEVEKAFTSNPNKLPFDEVAKRVETEMKIEPISVKQTVTIAPNGTADINIHSYCPDPQLPQQAGGQDSEDDNKTPQAVSEPEAHNEDPHDMRTGSEPKSHTAEIRSFVQVQYRGNGNKPIFVAMEVVGQLTNICMKCAAPNQSDTERQQSIEESNKASVKLIEAHTVPDTAHEAKEEDDKIPSLDSWNCACVDNMKFKPANELTRGNSNEINMEVLLRVGISNNHDKNSNLELGNLHKADFDRQPQSLGPNFQEDFSSRIGLESSVTEQSGDVEFCT